MSTCSVWELHVELKRSELKSYALHSDMHRCCAHIAPPPPEVNKLRCCSALQAAHTPCYISPVFIIRLSLSYFAVSSISAMLSYYLPKMGNFPVRLLDYKMFSFHLCALNFVFCNMFYLHNCTFPFDPQPHQTLHTCNFVFYLMVYWHFQL